MQGAEAKKHILLTKEEFHACTFQVSALLVCYYLTVEQQEHISDHL